LVASIVIKCAYVSIFSRFLIPKSVKERFPTGPRNLTSTSYSLSYILCLQMNHFVLKLSLSFDFKISFYIRHINYKSYTTVEGA